MSKEEIKDLILEEVHNSLKINLMEQTIDNLEERIRLLEKKIKEYE